jgi:hypothetical protein
MIARENIIAALYRWIGQRPGLEFGNYGDAAAYRSELRSITKDGAEAKKMLRAVERSGITAEQLVAASKSAYSGRLTMEPRGESGVAIIYCTGQYWPTEYRAAVCAVLSSALWYHWREGMEGENLGERLQKMAAQEFGRGIAARWFR